MGTPILESQACGVPVVSNFIENITDTIIKENKGGYFLDLDSKRWARAIQNVIKIPKDILIDNANYINNISSSKIIDAEYFKKIKKLIHNES